MIFHLSHLWLWNHVRWTQFKCEKLTRFSMGLFAHSSHFRSISFDLLNSLDEKKKNKFFWNIIFHSNCLLATHILLLFCFLQFHKKLHLSLHLPHEMAEVLCVFFPEICWKRKVEISIVENLSIVCSALQQEFVLWQIEEKKNWC